MSEHDRTTNPPTLQEIVRQRRLDLGLTQEELAAQMDMSQRWVSTLESGGIRSPRLAVMRRLAHVLRLSVEELFVAAGIADTASGAARVNESIPADHSNAPLSPEEEAVLRELTFMGYGSLTNAQLREIIAVVTRGK